MSFVTSEFAHCDFCNMQEQTFDGVPVGWATVTFGVRESKNSFRDVNKFFKDDSILLICAGCLEQLFRSNDARLEDQVNFDV